MLKPPSRAGIETSMVRPAVLLVILGAVAAYPQGSPKAGKAIDVRRSTITVHVERAGFFSFAGDNHEIRAPLLSGSVSETEASGNVNESSGSVTRTEAKREVTLVVDAARMQVLDPGASPETRAKVQAKMLGPEVLDVARFPRIEFRSRNISVTPLNGARLKNPGDMLLRIAGDLTLHGQTHPVELEATGASGHYRGSAKLKQSDFGIKPITIAGGAVKVKDEVRLDFEIFTQ